MYNNSHMLGASTTAGGAALTLPLTSGNNTFQVILVVTAIVAVAVLGTRIVKLIVAR